MTLLLASAMSVVARISRGLSTRFFSIFGGVRLPPIRKYDDSWLSACNHFEQIGGAHTYSVKEAHLPADESRLVEGHRPASEPGLVEGHRSASEPRPAEGNRSGGELGPVEGHRSAGEFGSVEGNPSSGEFDNVKGNSPSCELGAFER
ncbi:hypothetical protein HNR07_002480 [Nocardiopsis metallicus]|uniref:Uncharacterized protein n=2 Tax=Nocardiopsis metallicus TaxID=179819 RepID=A0A840W7L8_9ACTN|nr:hypothetical protein [Nocardiopsis metallicus]